MKRKNTKKDFKKFSSKASGKRRSRERSIRELTRALEEVNMSASGVKFKDAYDRGRGARVSPRARRDEISAQGIYSSSKSGFGFVKVDGCERDIFIPEGRSLGAFDGDVVDIIYHTYERLGEEKTEGRVIKIVKYAKESYIGIAMLRHQSKRGKAKRHDMEFYPNDKRLNLVPIITDSMGAADGELVEVVIDRCDNPYVTPTCRVVRVFGDISTIGAHYEAILSTSGVPIDFTEEELREARLRANEPISLDGRLDLTGRVIFTIDGADAKDLDDAISVCELEGGRWLLGVHIADVSHYVREKTPLDRAVMARGTSVYFTDKVVPMLPPELSNGACSLNSGERKYALSADITLSPLGEIEELKLSPSVIVSRVRGVYSEVNEILSGNADDAITEKYACVLPELEKMHKLYLILKRKSEARGAIDFDAEEARVLLDERGYPIDIVKRERGVAERIIEQFMLTANEAVARELTEREIPCVYRVHAEPPEDKLESFVEYAHNLGFNTELISKGNVTPKALGALLRAAEERELIYPVSYAMLRSMSKAEYSKARSGHFGLGLSHYCHFTSPIRRLSDLAVHRIIHRVIFEGKSPKLYSAYAGRAAAAATDTEIRAVNAERSIESFYKTVYMSDFIDEEFDAKICSVTSFGLFVRLENTCEGLVPISTLDGEFFYDEKNITLRSYKKVYHLGEDVRVRLADADLREYKLSFLLES